MRLARHRDGPDDVTNIVTCWPRIESRVEQSQESERELGRRIDGVPRQTCKPSPEAHMSQTNWDRNLPVEGPFPAFPRNARKMGLFSVCMRACAEVKTFFFSVQLFQKV